MKTALVLGSAACVWEDVAAARRLGSYQAVVGCNDTGVVWPGVMDAWVSFHENVFHRYAVQRDRRGLPPHKRVLVTDSAMATANRMAPVVTGSADPFFPGQSKSGTSGLFALKVALIDLGFDRAVLCGMPMQNSAGHLQKHMTDWAGEKQHRAGWLQALPEIKDRARSMSGWTQQQLGAPTPEWLAGD